MSLTTLHSADDMSAKDIIKYFMSEIKQEDINKIN